MELDPDKMNRLSLGLMEKDGLEPDAALEQLQGLKLNLICGEEIRDSLPLQAALLTAVNTAKRSFLGGVFTKIPAAVTSLLPWSGQKSINEMVVELGGQVVIDEDPGTFSLAFGIPSSIDGSTIQVACNGWQGGVLTNAELFEPGFSGNVPIGGIFAGGLAVALAFFKTSGINIAACDKSVGISLWRPDLHWLNPCSVGPKIRMLPKKYWVLGLGHLGQAYLWNIGLLPYPEKGKASILLQDYEKMVDANWSAGLLVNREAQSYKTRVCSNWLESRGFETKITERAFDEYTQRKGEEPFLALCGFDNAGSRRSLEDAGFDLVVEVGLGNNLHTFDLLALHTFPEASVPARDLWETSEEGDINRIILGILEKEGEECGIIPMTIAGKSVSASFVGACSGAMVIAESLRSLHNGKRYDKIVLQLRNLEEVTSVFNKNGEYTIEMSKNGWINLGV